MPQRITRRTFLQNSGQAAMVGGTLLATGCTTRAATLGANERVGLGWIGCGGRGGQLLNAFNHLPDLARVVACCDVHRGRAEAFKQAVGGHIEVYPDFRDLLECKDIDAVVVSTTGHWDAEKEEIKDDPEANKMLGREYRKLWALEV